jgi:hypothetical protein
MNKKLTRRVITASLWFCHEIKVEEVRGQTIQALYMI